MALLTKGDLAVRARRIADLERQRLRSMEAAGKLIVDMGRILAETKAGMEGTFKQWASTQLPFSYRTATRYLEIARREKELGPLLALDRTVLYELIALPPAQIRGLTPDSRVKGRRLGDLDCDEVHGLFHPEEEKRPGMPTHSGHECLRTLTLIKEHDPGQWEQLDDKLAALLGHGQAAPDPRKAPGVLTGATRDERAAEFYDQLQETYDAADDVDDAAGKLSPQWKLKIQALAMKVWTEINRLPAFSVPPKADDVETTTGIIPGLQHRKGKP